MCSDRKGISNYILLAKFNDYIKQIINVETAHEAVIFPYSNSHPCYVQMTVTYLFKRKEV